MATVIILLCTILFYSCTYNRTIVLQQRPITSAIDTLGGQSLDYEEKVIMNPIKK